MSTFMQRLLKPQILSAILAVVAVGSVGSYLLASSHALSPSQATQTIPSTLVQPYSLGTAPYQYIAYSGSLDQTRLDTGIKQYFAAFVITGNKSCLPAWGGAATGGMNGARAGQIANDFTKLRTAGGNVTVSFGGSNGAELATTCTSADSLAGAYSQVIDRYSADQIDFDIEGPALTDTASNVRRAEAISTLQQKYPDLKVWLTLPVHAAGLTDPGVKVVSQLRDQKVVLSGVNIMAMNYNVGSHDLGQLATTSAQASYEQLRKLYPNNSSAEIWKLLGITVMVGHNNTTPETFTIDNAKVVHDFVEQKGVGMVSIWNASRDRACPADGSDTIQARIDCSGLDQQPYDFLRQLTIKMI